MIFYLVSKSSRVAVFLSAIIPGGGQFYTENYLKGFIFFLTESYLFYNTAYNYLTYVENKRLFNETGIDSFRIKRDLAQNNLYEFLWWDGLIYMLSLLDAYVSAELYNFELDFKVNGKKKEFTIIYKFKMYR